MYHASSSYIRFITFSLIFAELCNALLPSKDSFSSRTGNAIGSKSKLAAQCSQSNKCASISIRSGFSSSSCQYVCRSSSTCLQFISDSSFLSHDCQCLEQYKALADP